MTTAPPGAAAQVWALRFVFCSLGTISASWTSRIPAFRDTFSLDHQQLGAALLMSAIGLLVAFPIARWLQTVRSSRWMTYWMVSLFVWGFSAALMDVGMNAHTVKIERFAGRAVISGFHAFFSIGSLLGAVLGALAAHFHLLPWMHFAAVVALCATGFVLLRRQFYNYPIETPVHQRNAAPWRPHKPSRIVLFLGALALGSFMIEGAMADWGAIYLRDQLSASLAVAPLGFAAYSVAMVMGRVSGDTLRERYSNARLMVMASVLATLGLLVIVFSVGVGMAIVGFFTVGLGTSIVVPVLFSIAGHLPGTEGERSTAQVTLVGYAGILAGPPLLGFIAHGIGLQGSFGLLAGLALLLTVAGRWLPARR
jgi:predicted MFS family arabinose efflux permease